MTDEPTFRPLGQLAADIFKRLEDDQRKIAMERWLGPTKAPTPQEPCDQGMFGDGDKHGEMKL